MVVALGFIELLLVVILDDIDEVVEDDIVEELIMLVEVELELVVEEDVAVLIELMENVMSVPNVAAAPVDLEDVDEEVAEEEIPEEEEPVEVGVPEDEELEDWASAWVRRAARQMRRVDGRTRTILCAFFGV